MKHRVLLAVLLLACGSCGGGLDGSRTAGSGSAEPAAGPAVPAAATRTIGGTSVRTLAATRTIDPGLEPCTVLANWMVDCTQEASGGDLPGTAVDPLRDGFARACAGWREVPATARVLPGLLHRCADVACAPGGADLFACVAFELADALTPEAPAPPVADASALPPPPPLPAEVHIVPVEDWNPARGPADAAVTMVVFGEYLCPFCKRLDDTLHVLRDAYGDRLRVVFRQFIVHLPAESLALAALAASRQGKFEKLHALFFADQAETQLWCYQSPEKCREEIDILAGQVDGLDLDRLHRDMDGDEVHREFENDQAAGLAAGAVGTPSIFVNGRFISGAHPAYVFGAWIDELLGITGTPTIPGDPAPPAAAGAGCGAPPALPAVR